MGEQRGRPDGFEVAPTQIKRGDFAHHGGDLRLIDHLLKYRSAREQQLIDVLFGRLARGDLPGLERSLRCRTVAGLRRRGVLTVERSQ